MLRGVEIKADVRGVPHAQFRLIICPHVLEFRSPVHKQKLPGAGLLRNPHIAWTGS
jgi:hypothetical protein